MTNLAIFVQNTFIRLWDQFIFRAVVTGTDGNKVFIKRAGQANPDAQSYARFVSYATPAADDEVLVIRIGGGYLVLGEIIR